MSDLVPAVAEPAKSQVAIPEPGPETKPAEETKAEPQPAPAKQVGHSVAERVEALRKGDVAMAVRQGERHLKELSKSQWTLRLEIACQPETLRRAVGLFGDPQPDLWVLPLALRDGRGCFQVFVGHYPNRTAAEKAIRKLPAAFRSEGNRPKPFKIGDIAVKQ